MAKNGNSCQKDSEDDETTERKKKVSVFEKDFPHLYLRVFEIVDLVFRHFFDVGEMVEGGVGEGLGVGGNGFLDAVHAGCERRHVTRYRFLHWMAQ